MLLHDGKKLDHNLGGGPDEDLPFAALLRVEHIFESIIEDADAHHGELPDLATLATAGIRGGTRNKARVRLAATLRGTREQKRNLDGQHPGLNSKPLPHPLPLT